MAIEQSPFEGQLDVLAGKICLGQVVDIDSDSRTVRVKTLGNKMHGTDDQDLQNVKIGHMLWNGDGSYGISMPLINSYYLVGFINSEPVLLCSYPLSNTEGGGGRDDMENLLPGDFAFVSSSGSSLIIRSGGTVEIQSTPNCRTFWLPTFETITTVCSNNEMAAAPGFANWTVDPDTLDTTFESEVYDNYDSIGTIVRTQVGTTDTGAVFDLQVGPPDDTLTLSEPTLHVSIQADGTTTVDVAQGKVTITLSPDGKIDINTESDTSFTVGGDTNINATGAVNVQSGGDTVVQAGGDCNVTASGNIVAKGSQIQLNGSASGITTFNSHMGVIDLITGAPVQPSTTVMGDI